MGLISVETARSYLSAKGRRAAAGIPAENLYCETSVFAGERL